MGKNARLAMNDMTFANCVSSASDKNDARPKVCVFMATYNGEKYLPEQIDSILTQEGVDLTLVIRDDGSTDSTVAICEQYARNHANIDFTVNVRNKGCALNFMDMIYAVNVDEYDFFAFSDQDDYWLPEKLVKAIIQLKKITEESPALYYSEVLNTDSNLENGHTEYGPFAESAYSLKMLLLVNWATGCTMVWNRKMCHLLKKAPLQEVPRMHDSWVHLVALTCGKVYADFDHSYIKRRITGANQVGERNFGEFDSTRLCQHAKRFFTVSKHDHTRLANNLLKFYSTDMYPDSFNTVQQFVNGANSLRIRCHMAMDSDYRVPSRKETLLVRFRLIANRY